MCTCRPCYLLFTAEDAELRYRAVPDRYLSFPDFALAPGLWDELEIPVGLAFLFLNSTLGQTVAFYPGPAGATESELPLDAWTRIAEANPSLRMPRPDVEALLMRAPDGRDGAPVCFLVPIDAATSWWAPSGSAWRGFDGGQEARAQPRCILRRGSRHEAPWRPDARARVHGSRHGGGAVRGHAQSPGHAADRGATGETVHALALRVQVRIEPQRRRYDDEEEQALRDLFGGRARFAETLKPFLWLHASTVVPGFAGSAEVPLILPCTYDFDVAGTTYLRSLRDGEIPLIFLFSGTVFTRGASGFTVIRCRGTRRRPIGCRYPCGVVSWTRTSRAGNGCASTATRSTPWPASSTSVA